MRQVTHVGVYDKNPGCTKCGWRWHGHGGHRSCCPECGAESLLGFTNWSPGRWIWVRAGFRRPWWKLWGKKTVPVDRQRFALKRDFMDGKSWQPYDKDRV